MTLWLRYIRLCRTHPTPATRIGRRQQLVASGAFRLSLQGRCACSRLAPACTRSVSVDQRFNRGEVLNNSLDLSPCSRIINSHLNNSRLLWWSEPTQCLRNTGSARLGSLVVHLRAGHRRTARLEVHTVPCRSLIISPERARSPAPIVPVRPSVGADHPAPGARHVGENAGTEASSG